MRALKKIYSFFITFPDRLYPFASEVEGKWVRGQRSYKQAVLRATRRYGTHRLGYKLTLYREIFHFLGSIFVIATSTILTKYFFGSDTALYFLLYAAIAALTFQEFYYHPKYYGQRMHRGVLDWSVWTLPMLIFLFRIH